MSSSTNPFDVLRDASPNAQRDQVPPGTSDQTMTDVAGGTGDQTMTDTDATAIDMKSMLSGLPAPPKTLTRAEKTSILLKQGAEAVEAFERNKKSRQADSKKAPGKPTPSAAPPQHLRKRKASSDSAEESSKRRHMVPRSPSGAAAERATVAPATASGGNASTSALRVQGNPILSPPRLKYWSEIRNPERPLLCILQVNDGVSIGSFYDNAKRWAFRLNLDAGIWGSPAMMMDFFKDGVTKPQGGKTIWRLRDNFEDDYMVRDIKFHRVADCAQDGEIRNQRILTACRTDQERARLVCISMESWPKVIGEFKESFQKHLSPLISGRIPYHIRIWFIAPEDVESFGKHCLSCFIRCFEERAPTYRDMCDDNGVSFEDHLKAQQGTEAT